MSNARMSTWVVVAFATTGLLIGFVVGLSHTPVVRGLLPLLFSVIGGGAGFFAVTRVESSRQIGLALAALSTMALFGVLQGIVIRDAITWRELFAGPKDVVLPVNVTSNPQRYARVLAIKLRMQRLDASPQELQAITEAAATSKDDDLVQIENTVLTLERSISSVNTVDISRGLASEDQETLKRKEKELGIPPKGISSIRPREIQPNGSESSPSQAPGQ